MNDDKTVPQTDAMPTTGALALIGPTTIKKAKARYHRHKLKKQFTVRIDEDLAKAVMARATSEGLRLTDAVEDGLWGWLQRRYESPTTVRGRHLWNCIPLWLQKVMLGVMGYVGKRRSDPGEEIRRRAEEDFYSYYQQTAECAQNLRDLAEAGNMHEEPEKPKETTK